MESCIVRMMPLLTRRTIINFDYERLAVQVTRHMIVSRHLSRFRFPSTININAFSSIGITPQSRQHKASLRS
jgi:hypothetical protein